MPDARLPSGWFGWLVAIVASVVGFVSGFLFIAWVTSWHGR